MGLCILLLFSLGKQILIDHIWSYLDFLGGSDSKASAYDAGDLGLIPGLGRFSGEGSGNPL